MVLRRVVASYRQGCLTIARLLLIDYHELLLKANELLIFEVMYLYLKAALERVSGDSEAAKEILEGALLKADQLAPGIITAATSSAAMNQNSGLNAEYGPSSAELSMKALEHLKHEPRSEIQWDMEQKAYINLATFHLGYDMSGKIVEKYVNRLGWPIKRSLA
jgi:hypothetical protein